MSAEAIPTWPVLGVGISDASCVARGAEVSRTALWCKAMSEETEGAWAGPVSEVLDAISARWSQILRNRYDGGLVTAA